MRLEGGVVVLTSGVWTDPDLFPLSPACVRLTMAAMGALGLGLYESPPAPNRSFPVYFGNGEIVIPDCE